MQRSHENAPVGRLEMRRGLAVIGLVVAMVGVSITGWNRASAQQGDAHPVASLNAASLAQLTPGAEPSLTVTGYGSATAAADSASVELLIGTAQTGYSSSMSGSSSGETVVVVQGPDTMMDGTPGANPPKPGGSGMSGAIDDAALEPVITALVDAGVARDSIDVALSPIAADPYSGSYNGAARLAFSVDAPDMAMLNDLIAAASQAASSAGLSLIQAGSEYRMDDCTALEDEAQQAAIDDAQNRATRLADQLGVTTGEIVLASDFGFFGDPSGDGGCAPYDGSGSSYTSFGGPGSLSLTLPDFDPSAPAEVTIVKQLYLGLAIV